MIYYVCFWFRNPFGLKLWNWGFWRDIWGWRRNGPQFYHLSVFFNDEGTWVHVNCDRSALRIVTIPDEQFADFLTDISAVTKILAVKEGDQSRFLLRGWFTCVTATKHMIGRGGSALSPNGLWDRLISEDAEIINGNHA